MMEGLVAATGRKVSEDGGLHFIVFAPYRDIDSC
jgi:hypothetical protein